jgi:hypothetical protein
MTAAESVVTNAVNHESDGEKQQLRDGRHERLGGVRIGGLVRCADRTDRTLDSDQTNRKSPKLETVSAGDIPAATQRVDDRAIANTDLVEDEHEMDIQQQSDNKHSEEAHGRHEHDANNPDPIW